MLRHAWLLVPRHRLGRMLVGTREVLGLQEVLWQNECFLLGGLRNRLDVPLRACVARHSEQGLLVLILQLGGVLASGTELV